jgi:hypothetical protein
MVRGQLTYVRLTYVERGSAVRGHYRSTAMVTASAARLDRESDVPDTDLQPVTIRRARPRDMTAGIYPDIVSAVDPVASPHVA